MDTIEYATFRYDTVEVENGLNRNFPSRFRSTMDFQQPNLFTPEYYFMKTPEINLVGFYLLNLAWRTVRSHVSEPF